jgi:hypothetical protein
MAMAMARRATLKNATAAANPVRRLNADGLWPRLALADKRTGQKRTFLRRMRLELDDVGSLYEAT